LHIFIKVLNIELDLKLVQWEPDWYVRTRTERPIDRRTEVTKVTGTFRVYANSP